jgi:RNA polymerase subunit RPABC4/transcription elongation factor Spt4
VFDNLIKEIGRLSATKTEVSLPLDDEGYLDRECPNEECTFRFKIHSDDWKNVCRDEAIFCPNCGHSAPSKSWFTMEDVVLLIDAAQARKAERKRRKV